MMSSNLYHIKKPFSLFSKKTPLLCLDQYKSHTSKNSKSQNWPLLKNSIFAENRDSYCESVHCFKEWDKSALTPCPFTLSEDATFDDNTSSLFVFCYHQPQIQLNSCPLFQRPGTFFFH